MRSIREKIIHYIYGIIGLLVSCVLAGVICMVVAICYFRGLTPDLQIVQKAFLPSLILVLHALPGLAIFLLWTRNMDRNGRPSAKGYSVVCLTLDGPLCAALVAMSSMTAFIATGNWRMLLYAEQLLAVFASVGFLTAIFDWFISIYLKSNAVTLLRESAKKELYSQF